MKSVFSFTFRTHEENFHVFYPYEPMKKYCIKVTASRVFEVEAKDYDSALEKAQEEYGKDPLTSQDIDSWVKVW